MCCTILYMSGMQLCAICVNTCVYIYVKHVVTLLSKSYIKFSIHATAIIRSPTHVRDSINKRRQREGKTNNFKIYYKNTKYVSMCAKNGLEVKASETLA